MIHFCNLATPEVSEFFNHFCHVGSQLAALSSGLFLLISVNMTISKKRKVSNYSVKYAFRDEIMRNETNYAVIFSKRAVYAVIRMFHRSGLLG